MGRRNRRRGQHIAGPATVALAAEPQDAPKPSEDAIETAGPVTQVFAEMGISGTVNYDGRIQAEANPELRDFAARGSPGIGYSWGIWERISLTDPAIASALHLVAAPLRDATLEVEPAEGVAGGELHADLVRDNLLKWVDPTWSSFVEETAIRTLVSGFDIHEPVLGTRADSRVPGGVAVFVAKLAQRLPSSLAMNPWRERNGELVEVVQQGLRSTEDGRAEFLGDVRLPADRILLTTWNRSGNNYEGRSALRSVYFLAKVREALLKIFAIGSEREALGVPVASVDKDAKLTTEQIKEWQNFLQRMAAHENAAAVPPPGMSFDWKFSPASNKGHVLDAWERLGKAIHMVFLTQQVTLGVDGTGSRSVGEVHDATKNDFIGGVKTLVEATLNGVGERPYTGLARRIVEPNFGPQAAYPRICLVMRRREVSAGELSTALPALIASKAITWRLEDQNQLRDKWGLSPITEEEFEEIETNREERRMEIAGQTQGAPEDGAVDEDGEEEQEEAEDQKPPKRAARAELSARRAPGTPFRRALYDWEQHLDLANVEATLNRKRDAFVERAGALLHSAIAEKMPEIRAAMADGDPSEILGLDLDLSKLGGLIDTFVAESRADGYAAVAREKRMQPESLIRKREQGQQAMGAGAKAIHLEEEEDDRGVDDEHPSAPPTAPAEPERAPEQPQGPTPEQRERVSSLMRRMREQLLTRMRARVIDDIETEAQRIIRTHDDPDAIVQRVVSRAMEERGLKFDGGSVQAKAFSVGRDEFVRERGDQVAAMQYSAVLDSATCGPCNGMDGREFQLGTPEYEAAVPPFRECKGGDLCRCLMVAIWKDEGFRTVEEAP